MKYQTINLNSTATLTCYILDEEISHNVRRKRPAMIICPGGGYLLLSTKEGEAIATSFLERGYNCFVLRYSTYFKTRLVDLKNVPEINSQACYPQQLLELMQTMKLLHDNAQAWNIEPDKIFIAGFSAGGHLAASLATRWNDAQITQQLPFAVNDNLILKPRGVILGYPMLAGDAYKYIESSGADPFLKGQIKYLKECLFKTQQPTPELEKNVDIIAHTTKDMPPVFLWMTMNDQAVDVESALTFMKKAARQVPGCECHIFAEGIHGLGRADEVYAKKPQDINANVAQWLNLALNWLNKMITH